MSQRWQLLLDRRRLWDEWTGAPDKHDVLAELLLRRQQPENSCCRAVTDLLCLRAVVKCHGARVRSAASVDGSRTIRRPPRKLNSHSMLEQDVKLFVAWRSGACVNLDTTTAVKAGHTYLPTYLGIP